MNFFRFGGRKDSTSSEEEECDVGEEDVSANAPMSRSTQKVFVERKSLPENFAEEVMDNEFAIEEGKFSIQHVDKLIYLYSQAMEYYEGYDNDKFVRFKDRINRLLMKPEVFAKMNSSKQAPPA